MRCFCSMAFYLLWVATVTALAADTESAPIALSNEPQLFLDDYLVATSHNLKRRVQTPARHARNPLIVQDRPWEKRLIQVYGTVLYDDRCQKYRCWYLASESDEGVPDTPEAPGTAEYIQCYAESDDGINWDKSNVGVQPLGRHREHNIVIAKATGFCVLPTPDDPDPQRQYRGLGGNVLGFSHDGLVWDMQTGSNWPEAVKKNDTGTSFVRWHDNYLAFVRFQEPEQRVTDPETGTEWRGVMRSVGVCSSQDFLTWTPKEAVFKSSARDGYPWTQPYGLSVSAYGDVLIGLLPMLHLAKQAGNNRLGTMDVELIVSRDGHRWDRVAGGLLFTHGLDADVSARPWDARVYPSTTLFVKDDLIHIYYSGTNQGHGENFPDPSTRKTFGIGLATLPAERIVGLTPDDSTKAGMLETPQLKTNARALVVNAQITPGDLEIEVCDIHGAAIPGFERHECVLKARDPLRYDVSWQSGRERRTFRDSRQSDDQIFLRFILRHGELYAFQAVD